MLLSVSEVILADADSVLSALVFGDVHSSPEKSALSDARQRNTLLESRVKHRLSANTPLV